MSQPSELPRVRLAPLIFAWLMLVILTFLSLQLGQWRHGASWWQPLLAVIIWLKAWLVAEKFIEMSQTHRFIRNVLRIFIAFAPLALILTAFFGQELARWSRL